MAGKARRDGLGIDREVGRHAEPPCARAQADAEAGDDLVADEQGTLGAAEIAHAGEVARLGTTAAVHHHRLHDDGCDLAGMTVGGLERQIVPAGDHNVLQHAGRDAGRARDRHRLVGRPASFSDGRALM